MGHGARKLCASSVPIVTAIFIIGVAFCQLEPVLSIGRLSGQGFTDVTVQLNVDLPAESAETTLNNLQIALEEASAQLYQATRNGVYLKDVKVHIPPHWQDLPSDIVVREGVPQKKFDIIVTNSSPKSPRFNESDAQSADQLRFIPDIYLSHGPKTVHAGNVCSRKGSHIVLPKTYIDNLDNPFIKRALGDPGKLLAVEWTKYQWGVFDEHGYPMSKSFPFLIRLSTESRMNGANGCFLNRNNRERFFVNMLTDGEECSTNDTEPGKPKCLDPFKCMFVPTRESLSRSPTSLLHQGFWTQVTEYCNETTHDTRAITPHNLFCNKQSVWAVLNHHKHFQRSRSWNRNLTDSDIKPTIQFIRPILENIIFAVDVSSSMNSTRMEVIRTHLNSTLRKFRKDGVIHAGLVTFARTATEVVKPRSMRDPGVIDAIVNAIPLDGKGPTCIDCAIDMIIPAIIKGNNKTEVIFITDGYANELRHPVVQDMPTQHPSMFVLNDTRAAIIRVHGIYYGKHPRVYSPLSALATITGTQPFFLPVGSVPDSSLGLYLESALKSYLTPRSTGSKENTQVFERRLEITGAMTKQVVKIAVPASTVSMGQLSFVITYEKAIDFELDAARVTQNGRRLSRSTVIKRLPAANRIELHFSISLNRKKSGPAVLELYTKGMLLGTLRQALHDTPSGEDIQVSAWVGGSGADDGLTVVTDEDLPLEIHARVVGSTWEPLNEIPAVQVRLASRKGAVQELSLKDNGLDPDYKAGDGIYSGFLIDLEDEGSHYMDVQVYHPTYTRPLLAPGVKLLVKNDNRISLNGAAEDRIAPSRITDLQIHTDDQGKATALSWTAPGDDAMRGKAKEYLLQYFTDVDGVSKIGNDIKSLRTAPNRITAKEVPGHDLVPLAAEHEEYIDLTGSHWIQWLTSARDTLYFIVRAVDEAGNIGKVSNVAVWLTNEECYMPEELTTAGPEVTEARNATTLSPSLSPIRRIVKHNQEP